MKFNKIDLSYLNGKIFSNGRHFNFSGSNPKNVERIDFLENYCKNKTVIHFGFADHIPLIETKIFNDQWLHGRLIKSSSDCFGVDTNSESIDFIKNKYNIDHLLVFDVLKDKVPISIKSKYWDIVVLGEVLEHVNNPVEFLNAIKTKLGKYVQKIVITVPNAMDIININNVFYNIEYINSDHRYWFTPYTLAKILTESGLSVKNFTFSQTYYPKNFIKKFLINRFPMFRETLIMDAFFS